MEFRLREIKLTFTTLLSICATYVAVAQSPIPKIINGGEPNLEDVIFVLERMGYRFHRARFDSLPKDCSGIELILEEFEQRDLISTQSRKLSSVSCQEISIIFNVSGEGNDHSLMCSTSTGQRFFMTINTLDEKKRFYSSRPFVEQQIGFGTKIPVAFFGCSWYDEQAQIYRFCGNKEIGDMYDPFFDLSPHYYVISIVLER